MVRILMDLDMLGFFENLPRKFKFGYNVTRITGTLGEGLRTFMISGYIPAVLKTKHTFYVQ
jgi:hypothetical protein